MSLSKIRVAATGNTNFELLSAASDYMQLIYLKTNQQEMIIEYGSRDHRIQDFMYSATG
jgi:hypothetical protein